MHRVELLAQEHSDDALDLLPANVAVLLDALHPLAARQAARVPARGEDGVHLAVQADGASGGLENTSFNFFRNVHVGAKNSLLQAVY